MNNKNSILTKGQTVVNKYSVSFFLKKGSYAETYRVQDQDNKTKFLKLFDYAKLHRSQFTDDDEILEIGILKELDHPNLTKYNDCGSIVIGNNKYAYAVLDFISGETLSGKIARKKKLNPYKAKNIILSVLNGLNYLHSMKKPVIHNDINNQNIMLDLSGNIPIPKIIDFGHARYFRQTNKDFQKDGLNLFYTASEAFNKIFSAQTDVFSAGALYYHLLTGIPPYFVEISQFKEDRIQVEDAILEEREKPLKLPDSGALIDKRTIDILKKALSPDAEKRFQHIKEFTQALSEKSQIKIQQSDDYGKSGAPDRIKKGEGFKEIAGMDKLKGKLQNDVIDLINDPEGAKEYNISMPNGMLMYGPPGCGKTFFAEKFAEEAGFGYKYVNPSELASIYVHGVQGKIGDLFKEAKENAPFIICLDEVSSVFPKRADAGHHQVGEVDEFLTQLNNCGEEGVFVIALTNFPENIDNAVLRSGRLDIKIYISPPDFEARKEMFKMYLNKVPTELGIDYDKLADLTYNYASSEIVFIVDNIARKLRRDRKRIAMEHLENEINIRQPVNREVLRRFSTIINRFEPKNNSPDDDSTIGFT